MNSNSIFMESESLQKDASLFTNNTLTNLEQENVRENRENVSYMLSTPNDDDKSKLLLSTEIKKDKVAIKKNRFKSERPKNLPISPDCIHNDMHLYCRLLSILDIEDFQRRFYSDTNKIRQDIFILRHCAVSEPKRCKSKDGIQRKSVIVHYNISTLSGTIVPICRKTFSRLLGLKYGRVQGVINRYLHSKNIPTENRGGDRYAKKFHDKYHAIFCYLHNLKGTPSNCPTCGDTRTILSPEYNIRQLWNCWNNENAPNNLRVGESYFRYVAKVANFSFASSKGKDKCYRCLLKKKRGAQPTKKDKNAILNEDIELKILDMSFPPGEHSLFAPTPISRKPFSFGNEWKCGDELENMGNDYEDSQKNNCDEKNKKPLDVHQNFEHYNLIDNNIYQLQNSNSDNIQLTMNRNTLALENPNLHTDINAQNNESYLMQIQDTMHTNQDNNLVATISENNDARDSIDMSSNICNDSDCNILHLGSHYENLNEIETIGSQSHMALNSSIYEMKDYTLLCNSTSPTRPQTNEASLNVLQPNPTTKENSSKKQLQSYKCIPCKLTFNSSSTYHIHKRRHKAKSVFECDVCQRKFISEKAFKKHGLVHSIEKLYKCDKCDQTFTYEINLHIHVSRHNEILNQEKSGECHKCGTCLKILPSQEKLLQHIESHNVKYKKNTSTQTGSCESIAYTKLQQTCPDEKPHYCDICHTIYSSYDELDQHLFEHEPQLDYKCEICNLTFANSNEKKNHLHEHESDLPNQYECKICGKILRSPVFFKHHALTHTKKIQPFNCNVCSKSFSRKFHLDRHFQTHV